MARHFYYIQYLFTRTIKVATSTLCGYKLWSVRRILQPISGVDIKKKKKKKKKRKGWREGRGIF